MSNESLMGKSGLLMKLFFYFEQSSVNFFGRVSLVLSRPFIKKKFGLTLFNGMLNSGILNGLPGFFGIVEWLRSAVCCVSSGDKL